jgi:hypothetical protein
LPILILLHKIYANNVKSLLMSHPLLRLHRVRLLLPLASYQRLPLLLHHIMMIMLFVFLAGHVVLCVLMQD